jgi:hypothetical protein
MQYMTTAFSVRLADELLAESKAKALEAGESFTAYVAGALRARNSGAASILTQPMVPRETPQVEAHPSSWTRPTPETCAHPFRDNQNRCRVCGEQR